AEAATASPRFSESILRLNLLAPLNMAQQAYQVMQHQPEGGVIIFIGSVSASRPSPGTAVYGAAKAGIVALASSLAVEWGPKVRVLTISPDLIRTEQSHLHYGDDDGIAAVGAGIPAGRMGEPEDIANACLYAASPMAAYFSGTNLLLHGGGERPAFRAASNAGKAWPNPTTPATAASTRTIRRRTWLNRNCWTRYKPWSGASTVASTPGIR